MAQQTNNGTGSALNPPAFKTIVPTQLDPNTRNAIPINLFLDTQLFQSSPATVDNAFDANPIRSFDFITTALGLKAN